MKEIEHYIQIALFPEQREKKDMYDKFYSVYKFDFTQYHKLLKDIINEKHLTSAYDLSLKDRIGLRNKCYILDDFDAKRVHLGDEKHIFRIASLQKIYEKIFLLFQFKIRHQIKYDSDFETPLEYNSLIFNWDEAQAYISGTERKPIKDRVLMHIKLLKLTRSGVALDEAIAQIKAEFNIC